MPPKQKIERGEYLCKMKLLVFGHLPSLLPVRCTKKIYNLQLLLVPIAPAFSYYVHKFFGFDMNEIPATTAGGTTGFMNVLPQPLAPRRGDNDIGFVYEYQYADGTKQIKHDYHQKQ